MQVAALQYIYPSLLHKNDDCRSEKNNEGEGALSSPKTRPEEALPSSGAFSSSVRIARGCPGLIPWAASEREGNDLNGV